MKTLQKLLPVFLIVLLLAPMALCAETISGPGTITVGFPSVYKVTGLNPSETYKILLGTEVIAEAITGVTEYSFSIIVQKGGTYIIKLVNSTNDIVATKSVIAQDLIGDWFFPVFYQIMLISFFVTVIGGFIYGVSKIFKLKF